MGCITAKLKNGKPAVIMNYDVVLPVSSLENMSAEEIGEVVIALLPYAGRLRAYSALGTCQRDSFQSLEDFEQAVALGRIKKQKQQPPGKNRRAGCVYLISAGGFYKIGLTNKLPIRHKQIGAKLPFKSEVVHAIATSDISSLEEYWHQHFAHRRAQGEWFNLSPEDVMEFCSHERMEIAASTMPQS
jgi:hypothetical protein